MAELSVALVCRVGDALWALPIACVAETMRPLPVTAVAGTPGFVRGVTIARDAPVPVVDAGLLLGNRAVDATRFVLLRTGERRVALAVDAVMGVSRVLGQIELPPLIQQPQSRALAHVAGADAGLAYVLETARLVPDEVWRVVDADGARP
jgi:purine-binding chemotaxis protein CheW